MSTDVIGGFPYANPNCKGCGKRLTVENAWMADGCPCNSELGINSMNETRWRVLMELQQQQSRGREQLHTLKAELMGVRLMTVNDKFDEGVQLRKFRELVDRWVPKK